jgi:hypothetical protein
MFAGASITMSRAIRVRGGNNIGMAIQSTAALFGIAVLAIAIRWESKMVSKRRLKRIERMHRNDLKSSIGDETVTPKIKTNAKTKNSSSAMDRLFGKKLIRP